MRREGNRDETGQGYQTAPGTAPVRESRPLAALQHLHSPVLFDPLDSG